MEGSLYIRIRGRVQGPFEMEKLRALARRGQFSRMHQVSLDGAQWQSAGDYPELFASPVQAATHDLTLAADTSTTHAAPAAQSSSQTTTHAAGWFYAKDDKQYGPVDFESLKELVAQGRLRPDDAVWTEGMSNWATADSLAGLADLFTPRVAEAETSRRESSRRSAVGHDLLRTLGDSQGWVLFIALVGLLTALALAAGGLLQLATARASGPAGVGGGLFGLLQAALVGTGSILLLNYRSKVAQARYEKTEAHLDAAFRALGRVWLFAGIVLIVTLVGLILLTIAFLAAVSSLSGLTN